MRIALKSHTDSRSGTRAGVAALAACLLALGSSVPLIAFADQEQAAPAAATTEAPAAATAAAPAQAAPAAAAPPAAPAPTAPYLAKFTDISSGDTAWMLTSTALVLMMTIPGLGLFYGGMVRKKNVIATVAQSFAITCIVTVLWFVCAYSLAFTPNPD